MTAKTSLHTFDHIEGYQSCFICLTQRVVIPQPGGQVQ